MEKAERRAGQERALINRKSRRRSGGGDSVDARLTKMMPMAVDDSPRGRGRRLPGEITPSSSHDLLDHEKDELRSWDDDAADTGDFLRQRGRCSSCRWKDEEAGRVAVALAMGSAAVLGALDRPVGIVGMGLRIDGSLQHLDLSICTQ
ncbi:hypothetical protein BHE74_00026482 [Ensete ventricosum]|uniref:Uncharacterized protein n=1 Tax=Ensete ventricosum TaxID=4639 RepID=A0A426ZL40_ENSVE|nr:hypothetical protein B296_00003445 [Ensete ventricosum]RWW05034.1 hypothetical protein GW17_00031713 [Ensete ventricosum]RWW66178.1 hypothetical protein BHE74_00026482 [Ensete ventricosum]RZR85745.1 hypothetical protein BHM03_00012777 [Ensete ventricosum]